MANQVKESETQKPHDNSSAVLAALRDILASSKFANADRLKNFLEYVVTETLNDRADTIKGKTIAQEVYGRVSAGDGDSENVVRVDARRLRRRLSEYYTDEGKDAQIRFHIDSGGYVPRFEVLDGVSANEKLQNVHAAPATKRRFLPISRQLVIGVFAVVFTAAFIAGYLLLFSDPASPPASPSNARDLALERQALLEKSPATLQAFNMIEQARQLIFPIFDLERQQLALGFFQKAIQLDPSYYDGYAGAALTTGTLALLGPDGTRKDTLLEEAKAYSQKAVELNPTSSRSQSAAAWVELASGNTLDAIRLSERAHTLAPDDLNVLGLYGIVALASGNPKLALDLSSGPIEKGAVLERTAIRNVYAVANYFLGNYREALKALQTAAERGEPVSSGMMAIQISAHHALGEMVLARKKAKLLQENWPVPVDQAFERLFSNPEHSADIAQRLREAGWAPPGGGTSN